METQTVDAPPFGENWREKGGYLEGIYVVDGQRVFRGLGRFSAYQKTPNGRTRTPGQQDAAIQRAWEAKRLAMGQEEARTGVDQRLIEDVMGDWIESGRKEGIAEETISKHYQLMKAQYIEAVGNHRLSAMEAAHVDDFKAFLHRRSLAPTTINMRLTRLRTFLGWAVRRKYLEGIVHFDNVRVPRKVIKSPDTEQVKAFFERLLTLSTTAKDKRHRYYYELHFMEFLFVLCTGVRRSAPFLTPWDSVHLDKGLAFMPEKMGEEALILPGPLIAYLHNRRARYPKHKWLFQEEETRNGQEPRRAYANVHSLTTAFRRHQNELGFGGLKIKPLHGFRSSLATVSLDQLGMDSATVANLLGHSSFKTTEAAYLSSRLGDKRRAVEAYEKGFLDSIFVGNFVGKFEPTK